MYSLKSVVLTHLILIIYVKCGLVFNLKENETLLIETNFGKDFKEKNITNTNNEKDLVFGKRNEILKKYVDSSNKYNLSTEDTGIITTKEPITNTNSEDDSINPALDKLTEARSDVITRNTEDTSGATTEEPITVGTNTNSEDDSIDPAFDKLTKARNDVNMGSTEGTIGATTEESITVETNTNSEDESRNSTEFNKITEDTRDITTGSTTTEDIVGLVFDSSFKASCAPDSVRSYDGTCVLKEYADY